MSTKTQDQFIEELDALRKAHPDLKIRHRVDCDILNDDYSWVSAEIVSVTIETWFETESFILTNKNKIIEFFEEQVADEYPAFSDKRIEGLAKGRYDQAQITQVICVYLA